MKSNNGNIHENPDLTLREALLDLRRRMVGGNELPQGPSPAEGGIGHEPQPDAGHITGPSPAGPSAPAIRNNRPVPSRSALWRSKDLHESLAREDLALSPTAENIRGEGVGFKVVIEIDDPTNNEGKMEIPFYPLLLAKTPRNLSQAPCSVCGTNLEFSPSIETWARATQGFGTQWIAPFLTFLQCSELPDCRHPLDVCRACMATHIQAQVAHLGRSALDNIKCPSLNCRHKLTYEEIRHLAPAHTFDTYDRLAVRELLSGVPDFRWCLRSGCESGGFYKNAYLPLRAASNMPFDPCPPFCITCPDCEMAMCFNCQVPWHVGLTCAEYRDQQAAESDATNAWFAKNTQPCPARGCGVRAQVEGGCFRVHCGKCGVDFCWECLHESPDHEPTCRKGPRPRRVRKPRV